MLCLQFAIGVLNDVADAPRDGGRSPQKPIPSGFVRLSTARGIGITLAAAGLLLAAPSGVTVLVVAGAGLTCGLAYDFALARTAISWLPLAIALPLVPLYAWLGASGTLPAAILVLVPLGALAGGGLAVANALVDLDTDRLSDRRTVAVVLGPAGTWVAQALCLSVATVVIVVALPSGHLVARIVIGLGTVMLLVGAATVGSGAGSMSRFGWQVEAAGVAALGIGWILAATGLA